MAKYRHVYIVIKIHDRELADKCGLYEGQVLFWNYHGKTYTITVFDSKSGEIKHLATIKHVGKCLENEDKLECARRLKVICDGLG